MLNSDSPTAKAPLPPLTPNSSATMPPSETEPIRYPSLMKQPLLETPLGDPQLNTPHAIFFHAAKRFPMNPCLGFRKIDAYVTEVVKTKKGKGVDEGILIEEQMTRKECVMVGNWEYKTYDEVANMIRDLAVALIMKVDGRLHMLATSSCWWFILSQAASMSSTPLVTVYTKIGQSTLHDTLVQAQSVAIFVDSDLLPMLMVTLIECPHIKTILYHSASAAWKDLETVKVDVENLRNSFPGVYVSSIADFMRFGGTTRPNSSTIKLDCLNRGVGRKDMIWGIMYPLGGPDSKPKGVLITSRNMVAGITSMKRLLQATIRKDDTYFSYLPLCFMLEYTLVNAMLLFGLTVGFATKGISCLLPPPYSKLNIHCRGDIETFAPSILFGIPTWWDEIHGYILGVIKENDISWQQDFWKAVARKKTWLENPIGILSNAGTCTVDNTTWIRTVREKFFGTRIRWIGVSCAMQGLEKKEFLGLVMSSSGKMVEGFSFMEMSTVVTFMPPHHFCSRTLGFPLPSIEMKLVSVKPQYIATSSPARGEIYIRGPSVPQMGFHANPEASVAAFLDDGWVKTGEIGEWDFKNPGLKIIGRVKPLKGRFMGEFVPVERLEKAYEASNVVRECCLVHSWRTTQPVAIISASVPDLRRFANYHFPKETPGMSNDSLLLSVRIKALLLKELRLVAREQGCVDCELICGVIMTAAPLPKKPRPQRAKTIRMTWVEQTAADASVPADLDRKAIAVNYSAEIEVMLWALDSDPDRVLIQPQFHSMSYLSRTNLVALSPTLPKMVPRDEKPQFLKRRDQCFDSEG